MEGNAEEEGGSGRTYIIPPPERITKLGCNKLKSVHALGSFFLSKTFRKYNYEFEINDYRIRTGG
jgi:hypothetical protein